MTKLKTELRISSCMPRFHINIFNDLEVMDEEGSDHADLPAAKQLAITGAREMIADHVLHARPINLRHRVEITNADGTVLAVIPFGELLTIID